MLSSIFAIIKIRMVKQSKETLGTQKISTNTTKKNKVWTKIFQGKVTSSKGRVQSMNY